MLIRGFVNFTLKSSALQAGIVISLPSAGLRPSVMKMIAFQAGMQCKNVRMSECEN